MTEWFRTWIAKVAKDFVTCFITKDRWKYIVKGLGNTLQIALAAVLLAPWVCGAALVLGFL